MTRRRTEPRCRLLDERGHRCPDPEHAGTGLCESHLGQVVRAVYRMAESQAITIRPEPHIITDGKPTT